VCSVVAFMLTGPPTPGTGDADRGAVRRREIKH
jgi:hypothetical protein